MKLRSSILFIFLLLNCNYNKLFAQAKDAPKMIPAYSIADYKARINNPDTIYIINYWATWCLPCVKELPYFENIQKKYKDKNVKVLLVSFDFKETYPNKLTQWVEKKGLQCEVIWFSNQDANTFIPEIAPEWEGNLPATILLNKAKNNRRFIADATTEATLDVWIKEQL